MHTLGEHLEKLGNVNYMIRVDRLHELYAWLSKMCTGTGNHIANLGDLFKVYLGGHLKYHMAEHESFRELQAIREQVVSAAHAPSGRVNLVNPASSPSQLMMGKVIRVVPRAEQAPQVK